MADKKIGGRWFTDKELNELIERNTPKPMKKYIPITEGLGPWDMCPSCGRLVLTDSEKFCSACGQALDRENYEL